MNIAASNILFFSNIVMLMICTDILVYSKINLGTLAAEVNCTIVQKCVPFCLLKIGKQTAVICYVRYCL